jgi:hypothetical protein
MRSSGTRKTYAPGGYGAGAGAPGPSAAAGAAALSFASGAAVSPAEGAPAREGGSECTVGTRVGATVGREGGGACNGVAHAPRAAEIHDKVALRRGAGPCDRDAACPISTG